MAGPVNRRKVNADDVIDVTGRTVSVDDEPVAEEEPAPAQTALAPTDTVSKAVAELEAKKKQVLTEAIERNLEDVGALGEAKRQLLEALKEPERIAKAGVKDLAIAVGILADKEQKLLDELNPERVEKRKQKGRIRIGLQIPKEGGGMVGGIIDIDMGGDGK